MTMTPKQLSSLDRSARRAVARRGDGDEKLSLYIRVAESRIYNGKPVLKALLKEVIFLRLHDLHENDLRIPKHTPWSKDYRKYEGWCYAGQEYLANRVGCDYTYAIKVLGQIVADGYLKARKWRGKDGRWHKQYFPDETFIDAKIEELQESADISDDNSDGTTHLSLKQVPTCTNDSRPPAIKTGTHLSLCPEAPVIKTGKEVSLGGAFRGGDLVRSLSTPPSGIVKDVIPPNQEKAKPNPVQAQSSQAKREATPKPKKEYCANPDCGDPLVPGKEHVCREVCGACGSTHSSEQSCVAEA
jgi:hypothetical protein